MVTFADQYKADVAAMFADGMPGVISIIYTPNGSAAVTINAIESTAGSYDVRDNESGETLHRSRELVIQCDAESGVAAPAIGDIVTIDLQDWKVVSIGGKDAAKVSLNIVWSRTESKHNSNFKNKITS